jgi:hypothetical protein
MAVRITTTPTNPTIQRKTPEMKKARRINMTPVMNRKTPSPLPTFFAFTTGFSSLNSRAINKKPHPFSRRGSYLILTPPLYGWRLTLESLSSVWSVLNQ